MPWESDVSGGGCGRILRKSNSFHQSDFRQRCETCSLFHVYAPASWAFPSKTCLQGKKSEILWSEITVSFSAFFLADLYFIRKENVSLFFFFLRWMSPTVGSSHDFRRCYSSSLDWICNKPFYPPRCPESGWLYYSFKDLGPISYPWIQVRQLTTALCTWSMTDDSK